MNKISRQSLPRNVKEFPWRLFARYVEFLQITDDRFDLISSLICMIEYGISAEKEGGGGGIGRVEQGKRETREWHGGMEI